MTLIELYDKTPVENILGSLALKPDKVVYITSESRKAIRAIPNYQKILKGRGIHAEMRVKSIAKNDLEAIVAALYDIISDPSDDYIIDISGGDEGALVALGIVLGSTDLRVSAFRMNAVSRRGVWFEFRRSETGRRTISRIVMNYDVNSQVCLTVQENILLHGGRIYGESYTFRRDDPVCGDIDTLWQLCRRDCSGWNAKINRISACVSRYAEDKNDLYCVADDDIGRKGGVDREFWNYFLENGFVLPEKTYSRRGVTVFRYKSKPIQDCLTKAGSLFEYYTYKTALECERDGVPLYDSATTGIILGWNEDIDTTRNEIDVMLMAGMIPVFISCKNGDVETDELYKLNTVSKKFGVGYARSALTATAFFDPQDRAYSGDAASANIKGRADDMNVRVIGAVNRMGQKEFREAIANLVR
ncbi:MAG: hypothetical protein IJW81_09375 [Clostridia bacterium]|nr:hypothetical protein [Clostridia bacterium]